MTTQRTTSPELPQDAQAFLEEGQPGWCRGKLPIGTILLVEHNQRQLTVERSNGYVITGFWDGVIQRGGGVDLRTEQATIIRWG